MLEARAQHRGPEHQTYVRVAGADGKIYIDLADKDWRVLEVDADGWRLAVDPPVRFRRKDGMRPLPLPDIGDIATLKDFVNIKDERDFALMVCWIIAALRDHGPYPILVLAGEQGTAKTTLARFLRMLIDPNTAPLRALPRDDRELCISAKNAFVLCYDNVSGIPAGLSDMLCRVSTGGGNAVRQLYTDGDEVLFDFQRPIIMNGITDIVSRPDVADRAIFITLEPIPETERKTEADLTEKFLTERPRILGALLDAVSHGLRNPRKISEKPRMADFAEWAVSCEGALWEEGAFMRAYHENIAGAVDAMIDTNLVAAAVRDFMETRTAWSGTMEELLELLTGKISEKKARMKEWPQTARGLSGKLTRSAANLRKIGIEVRREDRTKKERTWTLSKVPKQPSPSSSPSPGAENSQKSGDGRVTVGDGCPAGSRGGDGRRPGVTVGKPGIVTNKPLENNENDGGDGDDGRIPHPDTGTMSSARSGGDVGSE
jgi:hypothetical protein